MKKWLLKQNKVDTEKMAKATGISNVVASVLANRGIGTTKDVRKFIDASEDFMHDAMLFKDMDKALDTISNAVDNNQKIAVYGDYDVDGVMSSVILYKTIKEFTSNVMYYVPHRQKEGYGINVESIYELEKMGVKTVLTCDNGIAAIKEAQLIDELGMDLVIIDHHEPAFEINDEGKKVDVIPIAKAVVDHKQKDCNYPFKALCAGGMAYKFSELFFKKRNKKFIHKKEFIIFAAIATICDIVDLMDENRIIAKKGLSLIKETPNIGLQTLIEKNNVEGLITEYHIGFIIGPCINATGRLESAKAAIELFVTEDKKQCESLCETLIDLNNERKLMTQVGANQCIEAVATTDLIDDKVLVVYNENIHESIAGIIAGRVKEKFNKPTIVITKSEEMTKGSARSIEAYNVFEALFENKDLFHKFGGHPMAAGLSLEESNIEILRKRLNEQTTLTEDDFVPVIKIEKALSFSEINFKLIGDIKNLSPFGKENPTPIFGTKNVMCEKIYLIGKEKNIMKLSLRDLKTGIRFDGIDFNGLEDFKIMCENKLGELETEAVLKGFKEIKMDIVYNLGINSYNGNESIQLMIKDIRL